MPQAGDVGYGQSGALEPRKGGTGVRQFPVGSILYAIAPSVWAVLEPGSTADLLQVVAGVPTWVAPGTTTVGPHVLADTSGLGPSHTTSGLTARQVLIATAATTALFRILEAADIPNLATSKITSGTFADARISETSVRQHVGLAHIMAITGLGAT